jgi:hypothetical protein
MEVVRLTEIQYKTLLDNRVSILGDIQALIQMSTNLQPNQEQIDRLQECLRKFGLPENSFSRLTSRQWYNFFLSYDGNIENIVLNNRAYPEDLEGPVAEGPVAEGPAEERPAEEGPAEERPAAEEHANPFVQLCDMQRIEHVNTQILDLQRRIDLLTTDSHDYGKQNIVTFDGHGRTLFLLLDSIIQNNRNIRNLIFYEIDPNTIKWHNLFFPQIQEDGIPQIQLANRNIFDDIMNNTIDLNTHSIYLNFLSLGEYDTRYQILRCLRYIRQQTHVQNKILYISFTARSYSRNNLHGIFIRTPYIQEEVADTTKYEIFNHIKRNYTCVSRRGLFLTFKLTNFEIHKKRKNIDEESDEYTRRSSRKKPEKSPEKVSALEKIRAATQRRKDAEANISGGKYQQKYLKYKLKYLELKKQLEKIKI